MPRRPVAPSKQPGPRSQTALRKEQPDTRFLSTGYVSSQSDGLEEGARCRAEYRKIDTKPALTPVNCPPPKGTRARTQGERLVGRLRYGPVHTRRPHSVGQPSPSVVTGPVPATPAATLFCIDISNWEVPRLAVKWHAALRANAGVVPIRSGLGGLEGRAV
ncbi:unnamed protein product [Clonostachys byssicola]|uniref:Uncharacterized protein n=1 Tax=Clonostachys byssicola TaxID=160290 RepID=A0A9N9YCJ9_9HYPO|nr:unnamed protein product [Clonostachys byssicola]